MRTIFKRVLLVAAVAAMGIIPTGVVNAFNPSGYTSNGGPQFNPYTEVEGWGDEKDFLRVGSVNDKFADAVNSKEVCEGEAKVFVYVHNGAAEENNGANNDGKGVATDVKVKVAIPTVADNSQKLTAVISGKNIDNTTIPSVTDSAFITCGGEKVKVEYVKDSAEVVTLKSAVRKLDNSIVGAGALIGTYKNDGIVPGCWEFRNYVSLRVKVTKVPQTPAPVYSCDLSEIKRDGRKVTNNIAYTAKDGATFKGVRVDWGDGTVEDYTTATGLTHTYADDVKDATITSTVIVEVDGEEQTVVSTDCVKTVSFEKPETPEKPELPSTGAGSVIGLFAIVTLAAAAAHNVLSRRTI